MAQYFDSNALRSIVSGPGVDPRSWMSYGTVGRATPEDDPTDFSTIADIGAPVVHVILHPSGTEVAARVLSQTAGSGEGSWEPFVEGDQVLVAIPQGNERAGCVILGRLNHLDAPFPTDVAGTDSAGNAVTFKRVRTAFILESAAAVLFRQATAGSFLSLDQNGNVVASNGDKALFRLSADVVGIRAADGASCMEITVETGDLDLRGTGAVRLLAGGQLTLQASGANPVQHATSAESVAVLLKCFLYAISVSSPGAVTGAGLFAAADAIVNAAIAQTALPAYGSASTYRAAINAALAASDPTGDRPGPGSAGVLIG